MPDAPVLGPSAFVEADQTWNGAPLAVLRAAEVELNAALERLENRVTHCAEVLPERFAPVLVPSGPTESLGRAPEPDAAVASPLGQTIRNWTARINNAADRLEHVEGDLLYRVDL